MFLMIVEMRKGMKAKPAFLEIGSYWIDDKGNKTVIGRQRTLGMYIDTFAFGSPLEIRSDNDAFFHIAGQYVYPHIKVNNTIRRNGFRTSTYGIHPVTLFQQLLTNPKAETLMKSFNIKCSATFATIPQTLSSIGTQSRLTRELDVNSMNRVCGLTTSICWSVWACVC